MCACWIRIGQPCYRPVTFQLPTESRHPFDMTDKSTQPAAALVYIDELSRHVLSPNHPMRPIRLSYMHQLMEASGLLANPALLQEQPRPAASDEILRVHDPDYVEAVRVIGAGGIVPNMHEFGIGAGDNPPRPGMYDSTALTVGSTLVATELVMSGKVPIAFAPAGGVHHHAMRTAASGFGVFNDAAIAIQGLVDDGLRVAYVDIDCHHGDGVQRAFYETDRVLTISIHESGQWLFPGSGAVSEIGIGDGTGYSVNLPVAPYTQDDLWLKTFDAVVPQLVSAFNPDLLCVQLGIDTHFRDPLTHLQITTQGFTAAVSRLVALGATCERTVAVGGGGYDMSAVARAWTMATAKMCGYALPAEVPTSYDALSGLTTFEDSPGPNQLPPDITVEVERYAANTVESAKQLLSGQFGF
jgi:acetoin utilization protein AcuC